MKFNETIKAWQAAHDRIAEEVNLEGLAIQQKRMATEKDHKPDSQEFIDAFKELDSRVEVQKAKRAEALKYLEYIENTLPMAALELKGATDEEIAAAANNPVGKSAIMVGQSVLQSALHPQGRQQKGNPILRQMGADFQRFVEKVDLLTFEKVKSRGTSVFGKEPTKDGDNFNIAASWYGAFGSDVVEVQDATKSLGLDMGLPSDFEGAIKSHREAVKSMFTQVPGQTGGDGSLYAPTAVFGGNTGGLCEYEIDSDMSVLPYAPVSFLDCIPVRRISKSYVLFARQTLRVNNASAVAESLTLPAGTEPESRTSDLAIDFRVIKPESEFGFSQAKAITLTFADTLPVSEEFLEDCPAVADVVETQLMENVRQEFYDQLINGDGSGGQYPELVGLLAQVGLSTRIHRGGAAFNGVATGSGAADDNMRETIVRAIFDAEAYGYSVDCVLINHDDYTKMEFLKDEMGKPLYTENEKNNIKGAKVRKDVRMPAGVALVGAFAQVVQILIRRAIRLDIGWVDKQFVQDMMTLRASMRAGLIVKVPHALVRITALA